MRLSELAQKECIEMENGVRYGYLSESECFFHPVTGEIIGFELEQPKALFGKKQEPVFIPWKEIVLIGEDRILFQKVHHKRMRP